MGVRISLPVLNGQRLLQEPAMIKTQLIIMNKVSTYFRDSYKELLEKVTWPNSTQLQQSTMIVLAATLLITAIVWVMDFVAAGGLNFMYKMF
jgi:preprotein translocase subunit SecE